MKPQQITIKPTHTKDNGLWVRDLKPELVEVPGYTFTEVALLSFPPGQVGGNHRHPRVELFFKVSGEFELTWIDEEGKKEIVKLPDPLTGYLIPAGLPHAVKNTGNEPAIMIELATTLQTDVEMVEIV